MGTVFIRYISFIVIILILSQTFATADAAKKESADKTIAIVVDTSGSMRHLGGMVKSALRAFIEDLGAGWKVTFVTFDVFSHVKGTVHIEGQAERELLKGWVNSLSFNGRDTNFDEALKGAQAGLFQAGVTKDGTICIFSDGISDPSDSKGAVDLQATAKQVFPQEEGYSVYLIGIGKDSPDASGWSQQDNVVTVRISGEDVQKVLDGIRENQNLLELLTVDARAAATPEVTQPAEKRMPNLTPDFLRKNWKLLTLVLGLAVLCTLGYGIWWMFISEDPEIKKASGSQSTEVRRAQFTVLDSDQRAYTARIVDGNRIGIGNDSRCQVHINAPDPVSVYVTFHQGRAYLSRAGRLPITVNEQETKGKVELQSGDTVEIGNERVRFEVMSIGGAGSRMDELVQSYRR